MDRYIVTMIVHSYTIHSPAQKPKNIKTPLFTYYRGRQKADQQPALYQCDSIPFTSIFWSMKTQFVTEDVYFNIACSFWFQSKFKLFYARRAGRSIILSG